MAELIERTFMTFVAFQYPPGGVEEFLGYAASDALLSRAEAPDHLTVIALDGDRVVGVVELRAGRHISLMFVDAMYQRRGLGWELLQRVLLEGRGPQVRQITVNSSLNAVSAYRRMGFRSAGPQREKDGILYVPMALSVRNASECSEPH